MGVNKPRMREISLKAEEGTGWMDVEEKREQSMDMHLKNVNHFPQETEIGHDGKKEEAIPEKTSVFPVEKKEWRVRTPLSQQGQSSTEEEKADQQLTELASYGIMSDQTRPEEYEMVEDREDVSSTKSGSVNGSFSDNSSTIASVDGSLTTIITMINSSFGVDYDNTSDHGYDGNASTAVVPIIILCSNSNEMNCTTTNSTIKHDRSSNSAAHGTMYAAIGAESMAPYDERAASDISRFGSVRDSGVNESPFGSDLETLAGKHSVTSNYKNNSGFLDVRKSEKSSLGSDNLDTLLWSEQVTTNKSVYRKSERIPRRTGDSVNSKGPDGVEILHGLQIRGLESDGSAHPPGFRDPSGCADGLLGGSDCDSGIEEGEVLHQSQFTKAAKTTKGFSGARQHGFSAASASSEQMHQDIPSHSTVVTVITTLKGSDNNHMAERDWAELLQGWDQQSLGFVAEQLIEVEEEWRKE